MDRKYSRLDRRAIVNPFIVALLELYNEPLEG